MLLHGMLSVPYSLSALCLYAGYNGFPIGCSDDLLPWARHSEEGCSLDTKYPYVCHAEMNAILNKNTATLKGTRGPPCPGLVPSLLADSRCLLQTVVPAGWPRTVASDLWCHARCR